jgi:hypothetical protein
LCAPLGPAHAIVGVPDPRFSTVPPCVGACPAGDLSFSVTVRDVNNAPLIGVTVALDLSTCPNVVVHACTDCAEPYNAATKQFLRLTGVDGTATFHPCAAMYCPGGSLQWAEVSANGVVLANVAVHTTDVDADGDVDAQDVALMNGAIGGGTLPQGDEDCNLAINAADLAILNAHLGHKCTGVVPASPSTWGTLKATYR